MPGATRDPMLTRQRHRSHGLSRSLSSADWLDPGRAKDVRRDCSLRKTLDGEDIHPDRHPFTFVAWAQPPTGTSRLPPELIVAILEMVPISDRAETARRAALASRELATCARPIAWRFLALVNDGRARISALEKLPVLAYVRYLDLVPSDVQPMSVKLLLDLQQMPHLQSLRLRERPDSVVRPVERRRTAVGELRQDVSSACLAVGILGREELRGWLRDLRALHLYGAGRKGPMAIVSTLHIANLAAHRSLAVLDLRYLAFVEGAGDDLAALLYHSPALQRLTLIGCSVLAIAGRPKPLLLRPHPDLHDVHLNGSASVLVLACLSLCTSITRWNLNLTTETGAILRTALDVDDPLLRWLLPSLRTATDVTLTGDPFFIDPAWLATLASLRCGTLRLRLPLAVPAHRDALKRLAEVPPRHVGELLVVRRHVLHRRGHEAEGVRPDDATGPAGEALRKAMREGARVRFEVEAMSSMTCFERDGERL